MNFTATKRADAPSFSVAEISGNETSACLSWWWNCLLEKISFGGAAVHFHEPQRNLVTLLMQCFLKIALNVSPYRFDYLVSLKFC